jgi:hypothetical protein
MERKHVALSFAASYLILQFAIAYHVGANQLGPESGFVMIWGSIMMLLGSLGIALLAAKTNGQVVVGTILAFFGTAFGVSFFPAIAAPIGILFLFLGGYAVYRLSK